jgi:hypothetical protein
MNTSPSKCNSESSKTASEDTIGSAANDPRTIRLMRILKHIEAPDQAKFIRTSRHQNRNLKAKTRARFENLKQKLSRIAAKLSQLERDLDQYLQDYTSQICPILIDQLDTKLPPELRDEVYGYILGQKTIGVSSNEMFQTTSTEYAIPGHTTTCRSDQFRTTLASQGYGHLLESRAMPTDLMLELASVWYRLSTFRFTTTDHVCSFLETNFHGFSLNPQKLVRSIELFTVVRWQSDCVNLARGLSELHTLKRHASIQLSFLPAPSKPAPSMHTLVADASAAIPISHLALLFPSIRELVAAEYCVTVKLGYHLKFKVVGEDLTEESWADKVEGHYKVRWIVCV